MLRQLYVINGPNLNLLGTRETNIYGNQNLNEIEELSKIEAKKHKFNIKFLQSNKESVSQISLSASYSRSFFKQALLRISSTF